MYEEELHSDILRQMDAIKVCFFLLNTTLNCDVVCYDKALLLLTSKNDFGLVFGNPLYIVSPLAGKLAGSLTTFDT